MTTYYLIAAATLLVLAYTILRSHSTRRIFAEAILPGKRRVRSGPEIDPETMRRRPEAKEKRDAPQPSERRSVVSR